MTTCALQIHKTQQKCFQGTRQSDEPDCDSVIFAFNFGSFWYYGYYGVCVCAQCVFVLDKEGKPSVLALCSLAVL